jgi:hypothetical protein
VVLVAAAGAKEYKVGGVEIDRRFFVDQSVGFFVDGPSALLPINRRRRTPVMNPVTERRR